jgi:cardiolipin synthase
MPCFQNAQVKYYSFGKSYFIDLKEELNKATNFILLECYKIVPGNTWNEIFDILRLKAREGVTVKLHYVGDCIDGSPCNLDNATKSAYDVANSL